jgi:hypothetical protein
MPSTVVFGSAGWPSITPQNNQEDQNIPTGLTAQKRLWGHPSEKVIQRGGGGGH